MSREKITVLDAYPVNRYLIDLKNKLQKNCLINNDFILLLVAHQHLFVCTEIFKYNDVFSKKIEYVNKIKEDIEYIFDNHIVHDCFYDEEKDTMICERATKPLDLSSEIRKELIIFLENAIKIVIGLRKNVYKKLWEEAAKMRRLYYKLHDEKSITYFVED